MIRPVVPIADANHPHISKPVASLTALADSPFAQFIKHLQIVLPKSFYLCRLLFEL